jgi:hypothetical protein
MIRVHEEVNYNTTAGMSGAGNAHLFGCNFVLKMIILPRQARDKDRESAQKEINAFFAGLMANLVSTEVRTCLT